MTAVSTPAKHRRLSPEAGWLPLLLLLALAFITGRAIDDAKWVPGPESLTDFLPWTAMGGVLAGFVTSFLGWGRFRSAFAGAVAAAVIVPVLVGFVVVSDVDLLTRYQAAAKAAADATIDLIIYRRGVTTQFGHSLLLFGFLLWATGQFAAVAVYRYGRAMPAIVALGTYLVVNVSLTIVTQLSYLVAFSVAALLLLVRMHAVDERREWLRRRIGDPGPLASLTLRGGTVFVTLAICGALALTTFAHSKPLQSVWREIGVQDTLVDFGKSLQRWVPFVTNPRGPAGVDFGPTATIGLVWTADRSTAVVISRGDPRDTTAFYWRATAYDVFEGSRWVVSTGEEVQMAGTSALLADTVEAERGPGWREVSVSVFPQDFNGDQALSPGAPSRLDVDSTVARDADGAFVTQVIVPRGGEYGVVGVVPVIDAADESGLTESKLRAAGEDYLADLTPAQLARYTDVPPGVVGPQARIIMDDVLAATPTLTAYDVAATMVDYLSDSTRFQYSTDISSIQCGDRSTVECFAEFKQGFCQYYATTMAVLMRELGYPARFVQGFLPGSRGPDGVETIENAGSHAWVEVWFPGYGWYMFDPTGNGLGDNAPVLPAGEPIAIPSFTPRPSSGEDGPDPSRLIVPPTTEPGASGGGLPGPGPYIAIAALLVIAVGGLAFISYRRGPREVTPDSAWGTVIGVARRLGFGPRPTQTVYEYSAALAEVLPSARPQLETVARAKVEVAYGHRVLSPARVEAVKAATSRLRVQLLKLIVRRPRRRR